MLLASHQRPREAYRVGCRWLGLLFVVLAVLASLLPGRLAGAEDRIRDAPRIAARPPRPRPSPANSARAHDDSRLDREPPRIIHEPCSGFDTSSATYTVIALITDTSDLFEPRVMARDDSGAWQAVPMKRRGIGGELSAVVPGWALIGERLAYFIEAFDVEGNGPARLGSPEAPLVVKRLAAGVPAPACLQVPALSPEVTTLASSNAAGAPWIQRPPGAAAETIEGSPGSGGQSVGASSACSGPSTPWYCSGWLWAAVATGAAAAVGVGVATYVWSRSSRERAGDGTLSVHVTSPNPVALRRARVLETVAGRRGQ